MQRVPEPELMADPEQALAYASADFDEPHARFVALLRERLPELPERGAALDLGCGPGDVTLRTARSLPGWSFDALDGSAAMLSLAREAASAAGLAERVRFEQLRLPAARAPREAYDLVFANSLLHHLEDPATLWSCVRRWAAPGARVFVMDLSRPASLEQAHALLKRYAADEPVLLRRDFFHSLLAAYTPPEVAEQLRRAGLAGLRLETVSDRHWIAWGPVACGELRPPAP